MAELHFDGRSNAAFPNYLNPNIFFQGSPDDPTPVVPREGVPVYIFASVKNTGKEPTMEASVKFWICNPATVPTPSNTQPLGTSNVSLAVGETKEVLCVTVWVPQWINQGHECVVCEASATNDAVTPHPNSGWDLGDRHNAQRNVNILFSGPNGFNFVTPLAATGLFHNSEAKVSIRRGADELFEPALKALGLGKLTNVGKDAVSGLLTDYVLGTAAPEKAGDSIKLRDLRPRDAQRFHAMVRLPASGNSVAGGAAIHLVEQHDAEGKLVGGVALVVVAGERPKHQSIGTAAASSIPASIPFRPYASSATTGLMNPDGIFVSNLGVQLINIETRNGGTADLSGVSVYVEGVADPGVSAPLSVSSPPGGSVLPTASFKSIFSADFKAATPGETVVSLIVQLQSGSQTKSIRILKKIFVVGLSFISATKTFECKVPQGSLYVHINRAITPKPPGLGGSGGSDGGLGTGKCCCCCLGGGGNNGEPDPTIGRYIPYPIFLKSGTLLLVPSPTYAGPHGDLPFNDPWWKILLAIVAAILAAAGAIVAGRGGDDATAGPEGTFEENDPSVHCCTGTKASASTSNGVAAGLFGAAASDEADWHERGQAATPPDKGALTTGEFVKFDIDYTQDPVPGEPFKGEVSFSYERVLNTGATLRFSKQNDSFKNIHYLKSYQVSVDGSVSPDKHYTHTSRQPVIIGARFVKPDGSLFRGAELYVFALLVADTGRRLAVELRDDGYGSLAGFPDGGHDNKSPASPPGRLLSSRPLSPPGLPRAGPRPLVSESGVVVAAAPAGTDDGQKPNVGAYVGAPTAIARYGGPVTWYAFVFAQDVNSVPEGTDPRVAAKTIGGMLLTNNFVVGFNDKPCELNYDAAITYLGVARGGDNLR